jgi:hypothetical protein
VLLSHASLLNLLEFPRRVAGPAPILGSFL